MSLFPAGSGVTGAVTREKGKIKVELPLELDNSDPFVLDTMTSRVPTKIIGRTVEYNQGRLDQAKLDAMAAIGQEMRDNGKVQALSEGPNVELWNACLKPYLDKGATWSKLPWYVAETYVYHRLLQASGYWQPGPSQGVDIFAPEKEEALASALPLVAGRMSACMEVRGVWSEPNFRRMVLMALWGNQGDSSLFTVADLQGKGEAEAKAEGMLVDEAQDVYNWLDARLESSGGEVHFLNDNSGMELVSDLALAHYLLSCPKTKKVVFHLKPYPFFVSDALPSDVAHTLQLLRASPDPNQQAVAKELSEWEAAGRLELTWEGPLNMDLASPEPMWRLRAPSRRTLSTATLAFAKGDLMYRKLLGDRLWDTAEPFSALTSYLPCPLAALRTCKSPLATGISQHKAALLDQAKPSWKVDGDCGMIQACFPPPVTEVTVSEAAFEVRFDADKVEQEWAELQA